MNKCKICNSCLATTWINLKVYRYCDFCRKYFFVNGEEANDDFIRKEKEEEKRLRELIKG